LQGAAQVVTEIFSPKYLVLCIFVLSVPSLRASRGDPERQPVPKPTSRAARRRPTSEKAETRAPADERPTGRHWRSPANVPCAGRLFDRGRMSIAMRQSRERAADISSFGDDEEVLCPAAPPRHFRQSLSLRRGERATAEAGETRARIRTRDAYAKPQPWLAPNHRPKPS
jgi:hypothetical protein